jgi:hypothetical protein
MNELFIFVASFLSFLVHSLDSDRISFVDLNFRIISRSERDFQSSLIVKSLRNRKL